MPTQTVPATRTSTDMAPIDNVRGMLEKMKGQFAMALPKAIPVDRFLRVAITSCQKNPKLLDCHPITLLGAIMQAAQLGLIPDGILGEAYIIPYENKSKGRTEAQFQIGYKGIRKLVNNSGEIATFLPQVVYEGDVFRYNLAEARIEAHERTKSTNYGKPTFVYTIVRWKNGTLESWVMPKEEVDSIRDKHSQGYRTAVKYKRDDTPWIQHYDAMAMKTVMRRHAKYLPLSTEAQMAITLDEHAEAGRAQDLGMLVDPKEMPTLGEPPAPAVEMPTEEPIGFGEPAPAPKAATKPAPAPMPEEEPQEEPPAATKGSGVIVTRIAAKEGECAMGCGKKIKKGERICYDPKAGAVFHEDCV